jgi:hypothetical protein
MKWNIFDGDSVDVRIYTSRYEGTHSESADKTSAFTGNHSIVTSSKTRGISCIRRFPTMRLIAGLLVGCLAFTTAHPMRDRSPVSDREDTAGSLWHWDNNEGLSNHANMLSWDGDGPTVWHWMRGKTGSLAGWLNPWQEGIINIIVSGRIYFLRIARADCNVPITSYRSSRIGTSRFHIVSLRSRMNCPPPTHILSWEL